MIHSRMVKNESPTKKLINNLNILVAKPERKQLIREPKLRLDFSIKADFSMLKYMSSNGVLCVG